MKSSTLVVEVLDAAGMHGQSERLSHGNAHRYRLRDPAAAPSGPMALSRHVLRSADDLLLSAVAERLGTAVGIVEPGIDAFCFCDLRSGAMALTPPGVAEPVIGGPGRGLIHGGEGGLTALTGDGTARTKPVGEPRADGGGPGRTLEEAPRQRLRFDPAMDWSAPGPAEVRRLLQHAAAEFAREDSLTTQPVALATFTDLFVGTALRELPHNGSKRLQRPAGNATPTHLRRAEVPLGCIGCGWLSNLVATKCFLLVFLVRLLSWSV